MTDRTRPSCPPHKIAGSDQLLAECLTIAAAIHADDLELGRPDRTMQTAALLRKWVRHRDHLEEIRRLGT